MNSDLRCVCCLGKEFKSIYFGPDEEIIQKCCTCGLILTQPGLKKTASVDYYNEKYYRQWHEEAKNRLIMWRARLGQLHQFCKRGALLDIGCGLGDFASIARDNGWDVLGTEVSEYAVNYASEMSHVDIVQGDICDVDFGCKKFDVVTMWHVLEHMEELLGALRITHNLLKEDGLLVIEVPNVYYLIQMIKSYLKTRNFFSNLTFKNNPEPHYFHFSIESLRRLLNITGYRVLKIYVGIYGEHQSGILRRLKSKIYNIITAIVYMVTGKNIGVNIRVYAIKENKPLTLAMVSLDVRRDLQKPLDNFQRINIKHYCRRISYDDMTAQELTSSHIVKYRNGLDLFLKILKLRPDIIQGIEPYTFPAGWDEYLAILGLNLFFGIPFFFPMLENRPVQEKFGLILAPFLKLYLRFYTSRALFVIPINEGAKKNLLAAGAPLKKIRKLLWGCWGVDLDEFSPDAKPANVASDNQKIILFAGRLHYSKGINYLLEAFDRLRKEYALKLLILGEGKERQNIIDFCNRRKLNSDVILMGSVKNQEMPGYFRAAYLTVTPSITTKRWQEQVGMVNIQSLACGIPVVSTYSGAIPEFIKDGEVGLLVRERDADHLYRALKELLENRQLYSKISKAARQYCLERFDVSKNIAFAEEVILPVIQKYREEGTHGRT